MEQFIDTAPSAGTSTRYVPSDLVLIDGQDIYDILPGYQQLKTEGRGLVPLLVQTSSNFGQDGDNVDTSRLGTIDLTITFQLHSESAVALRKDLATLNSLLIDDRQERRLTFADDSGFSYMRCMLVETPAPRNTLGSMIVASFTFKSFDAYSQIMRQSDGPIALSYWKSVRPRRIVATFGSAVDNFYFENEKGQRIQFSNASIPANTPVVIEYTRERIAAYNVVNNVRVSLLDHLTKYNALLAFYLNNGGHVTVSPTHTLLRVEWGDPKL